MEEYDGDKSIPLKVWKKTFEAVAETHAKYWGGKNIPEDLMKVLKGKDWMESENASDWE